MIEQLCFSRKQVNAKDLPKEMPEYMPGLFTDEEICSSSVTIRISKC
jgi:hypothetical protein